MLIFDRFIIRITHHKNKRLFKAKNSGIISGDSGAFEHAYEAESVTNEVAPQLESESSVYKQRKKNFKQKTKTVELG